MKHLLLTIILISTIGINLSYAENMRTPSGENFSNPSSIEKFIEKNGDTKTFEKYKKTQNVNIQNDLGLTPLHWASEVGDENIVKELLDKKADPNMKDRWMETPLHAASRKGYTRIVKALLQAGAYPSPKNKYNYTPLDMANFFNKEKVAEILSEAEAEAKKTSCGSAF